MRTTRVRLDPVAPVNSERATNALPPCIVAFTGTQLLIPPSLPKTVSPSTMPSGSDVIAPVFVIVAVSINHNSAPTGNPTTAIEPSALTAIADGTTGTSIVPTRVPVAVSILKIDGCPLLTSVDDALRTRTKSPLGSATMLLKYPSADCRLSAAPVTSGSGNAVTTGLWTAATPDTPITSNARKNRLQDVDTMFMTIIMTNGNTRTQPGSVAMWQVVVWRCGK